MSIRENAFPDFTTKQLVAKVVNTLEPISRSKILDELLRREVLTGRSSAE